MRGFGIFGCASVRAKVVLLAFLGIVGVATFFAVNTYLSISTQKNLEIGKKSQNLAADILQAAVIQEKFLNTRNKELLSAQEAIRKDLKTAISTLQALATDKDLLASVQKISPLEEAAAAIFASMTRNLSQMYSRRDEIRNKIDEMRNSLRQIINGIDKEDVMLSMQGDTIDANKTTLRTVLKQYLSLWDERLLNIQDLLLFSQGDSYTQVHQKIGSELDRQGKNFITILELVASNEYSNIWDKSKPYLPQIDQLETALFDDWKTNQDLVVKLGQAGAELNKATSEISEVVTRRVESNSKTSSLLTWVIAVVDSVALMLMSFLIIRAITGALNRSIASLSEIASQVESGARQLTDASQQFADATSEQAASLEETSSSLEQMSSMTRQNACNAHEVNNLMKEATSVVEKANRSMGLLTTSMGEISMASEDTQKIVKTIDEIAFQTNLLALNAAVEAARAGEAGAGFAVVADEVRNLALRAAEAAGNTADLIEGTVKKVKEGADLVQGTNQDFTKVSETVSKSGGLVEEITAASEEQAHGIEQVNKAVSEMDKVTQQTSTNAEQSASASEQMSSQAKQMKEFVAGLIVLVGGNGKRYSLPSRLRKTLARSGTAGAAEDYTAQITSGRPPARIADH